MFIDMNNQNDDAQEESPTEYSKKEKKKKQYKAKEDEYLDESKVREHKVYARSNEEDYGKKKKKSAKDNEGGIAIANSLIASLEKCIKIDKAKKEKGLPALEKLRVLKDLEKLLFKVNISEEFLKQGGLKLIQEYIEKGSDDTYPPLNQIERIIDLLDSMPIDKNQLDECTLAANVEEIARSLKQSFAIQKKAKALINKWNKQSEQDIYNYALEDENRTYKLLCNKRKRQNSIDNPLDGKKMYETINEKRKIPQRSLFDFTINPQPKVIATKDEDKLFKTNYFAAPKNEFAASKKKKNLMINEL